MPDGYGGSGEGAGGASQGMGDGNGGNRGNGGGYSPADPGANTADAAMRADASAFQSSLSDSSPAASPFSALSGGFQTTPANQQALTNQETVRNYLAQVAADKQTALAKGGEDGALSYNPNVGTSVLNAADAARASGLSNFTTQVGAGKNVEGGMRDVTTQVTNIPIASFLGYSGAPGDNAVSYAEAQRLKDLGLGNLTGVVLNNMPGTGLTVMGGDGNPIPGLTYNNPGQTASGVVASIDAANALNTVIDIAKNFIPGYGIASFVANLLSGKVTVGQALTSVIGDRVASSLGIAPSLFRTAMNGDYGNGAAAFANSALNSYVSQAARIDPRLTSTLMNVTGLSDIARKAAAPMNVGPSISGAVSGAIDSGLSKFNIGNGPATSSPTIPYLGTDRQTQVENILNPSGISRYEAPASLDKATTPSTPGTPVSSGSPYSGALSSMSNSIPAGGLLHVGGPGYTPYTQNLAQLNMPTDQFTKTSDLGNIPMFNVDVARMANSPFYPSSYSPFDLPQYAATGGLIQRFDKGGEAEPTPEQLAQREALQAQAQYYKDKEAQAQTNDIMTSLKNLSGLGQEMAPAKPQLFHLGQAGVYTPPKVLPQLAAVLQARGMRLAEGGQPGDHAHPHYDGTPVFRTGGLEGLGGKYVQGKGNGTSDDITAMLADGEYVFSADVVSALGNGSNKAGAKVLDQTVHAIRERARSAPPDKLAPDAKSPLEYIQSVKGKKHG